MKKMKGLQMKYFILKPRGTDVFAKASRVAMLQYANEIMEEDRVFALDLVRWVSEESNRAEKKPKPRQKGVK